MVQHKRDLQKYISGGKVIMKTIIMASPGMVMDGLENEHIGFLYGLFICFGVTRNILKAFSIFVCRSNPNLIVAHEKS